uniref:Secreted protein n=1 Tax=Anguilla anguilla TaxID=7936 RepID=A0A0E9X6U6_ANGAN
MSLNCLFCLLFFFCLLAALIFLVEPRSSALRIKKQTWAFSFFFFKSSWKFNLFLSELICMTALTKKKKKKAKICSWKSGW